MGSHQVKRKKKPRDYQEAGAYSVWNYFANGGTGNPLVVMPTGTGKSLVLAMIPMLMCHHFPTTRILVVTHVKELVKNNYETMMELWPACPAGIYSAGLNRKDTRAQITYCGIDSVRDRAKVFGHIDVIFIDEAHRVGDSDAANYVKFIKALKLANPKLKVVGFTATDYRQGMGKLTDGELFDEVVFDLSDGEAFIWMIEQGYLVRPSTKQPKIQLDSDGVKIHAGEFVNSQASAAFRDQHLYDPAVDEICEYGEDRYAWLIFAQSVEDCELLAQMFRDRGITCEAVHSKMKPKDRDRVVEDFKKGKIKCVVNQGILTTGFDFPGLDLIAVLRLTNSTSLWVQILGRGTRPCWADDPDHLFDLDTQEGRLASIAASHKQDCLVLDYAGNCNRLGPINYPMIPKRRGAGGGEPPVRVCPECAEYNHISKPACEVCGYVFPVLNKLKNSAAMTELVVSGGKKPKEKEFAIFKVNKMFGQLHQKAGKPDSVRVDYFCGVRRFSTWVAPEHGRGFAQYWYGRHSANKKDKLPETAAELLKIFDDLRKPEHIRVELSGKYPEIVDYDFNGNAFQTPVSLGGPADISQFVTQVEQPVEPKQMTEQQRRDAEAMFDDNIPF